MGMLLTTLMGVLIPPYGWLFDFMIMAYEWWPTSQLATECGSLQISPAYSAPKLQQIDVNDSRARDSESGWSNCRLLINFNPSWRSQIILYKPEPGMNECKESDVLIMVEL